jgi:hypothetical protein
MKMRFSLTAPNLAGILDGELPGAMWEYYLAYSEHARNDPSRDSPHFSAEESRAFDISLPRGLRLVLSFTRFDGDVLNGGIVHYIGNHTWKGNPEEVFEDLEALRTIGAVESAAVLEEAISIFTRDYGWPSGKGDSCGIDVLDHAGLTRLDDLRCNEDSTRRDYAILNGYLCRHLDECILPVEVEIEAAFLAPFLDPSKRPP